VLIFRFDVKFWKRMKVGERVGVLLQHAVL